MRYKMVQTEIRKIDSANGVVIPAWLLKKLNLKTGDTVNIDAINGQILITSVKPKYTLKALLAKCDCDASFPEELNVWNQTEPVGLESTDLSSGQKWDSFFFPEDGASDDVFLER